VVVVNPEVSSVRDSDRILGLLASKTQRAEKGAGGVTEHLLLTRYSPKRVATGEMMSVGDVKEILGLDVVGVIPESPDVLTASNAGTPVILNAESDVARAYDDAVTRLLGESVPLRFIDEPKKGLFARMFGG
jgi:septum site-determining protein MinD